ncbi:MAG: ATP-binding cassette domain-containing protein [Bacteroidaceae bacterium]|nr:ATP-binding cassette domain-containing protein [Bacteroidaceae bacterium]
MIIVQNLNKSFDGRQVLCDINVEFLNGQTNLIIGQSGSGKTVLMNNIVGLLQPEAGHILYDGRDITVMSKKERTLLRREMGMLFQGSALFDSMTVLDNVMFPLDMFSTMNYKERKKRAQFCLDRVNMLEAQDKFPNELSGGMQKRTAIARAIAMEPHYLFCDEPNSGLDPKTSIVIDKLISDITHENNITTVVNTHDMNSVIGIGENILFIDNGRKAWQGSNKDVLTSDNKQLNDFIFASEFSKQLRQDIIANMQ